MSSLHETATRLGIAPDRLIPYGREMAKMDIAKEDIRPRKGKLILVTSITPTKAGNGKTTCSIGLADGLSRLGKKAAVALREPSLGPCFGKKGGATGGGKSQLVPASDINLHFTGDFHAVSIANNMLAALLDNYNYHCQGTPDELKEIYWRRVVDVNDRSLRHIITGLHGGSNGLPAETGFDITPASELMAVLCLSRNLEELSANIDRILLGYTADNRPFTVKDLKVGGSITALLKDALQPNLVQTMEGTPAVVHGGPFANIAHGCNSILATETALQYADYVLTEAGFGSDLGAEKFFNIKCRKTGMVPHLSVLVITLESLRLHGENVVPTKEEQAILLEGMRNVEHHLRILRGFGQRVLVLLNRFPADTTEDITQVQQACQQWQVPFAVNDAFSLGGEGATAAAHQLVELCEAPAPALHFTYALEESVEEKLNKIVRTVYGGTGIVLEKKARQQLKRLEKSGYAGLPVCVAKTQYSFTDDPQSAGRYDGFSIHVEELLVNAGAGFIVAVCGDIMRMPGLPETPNALHIKIVNGDITGLS